MIYNQWALATVGAALDGRSFKAALLTDAYVPDVTHAHWADVSAFESTGTGYPAGGVATTLSAAWDDGSSSARTYCADITFAMMNVSNIGALVIYDETDGTLVFVDDSLDLDVLDRRLVYKAPYEGVMSLVVNPA